MKNLITKTTLMVFALGLFVLFSACEKQEAFTASTGNADQTGAVLDKDDYNHQDIVNKLPAKVKEQVIERFAARGVNFDLVEEKMVTRPDGTVEKVYMVEEDIEMTPGQFREMAMTPDDDRQYVTNNRVNNNETYTVIGYTGSCCALTTKMRNGLQWAVDNYNRLNLGISLSLSYSASTSADIVVYNNGAPGGGGSAGFPSNGNPYKWVQINAGTDGYSTNVNEHVIGHEIGHCLGFRHTDYYNRSISCGSGGNEGSAGVGANPVPGTPTNPNIDLNSLMLACFSSNEDGEFSNFDIVALNWLFP